MDHMQGDLQDFGLGLEIAAVTSDFLSNGDGQSLSDDMLHKLAQIARGDNELFASLPGLRRCVMLLCMSNLVVICTLCAVTLSIYCCGITGSQNRMSKGQ